MVAVPPPVAACAPNGIGSLAALVASGLDGGGAAARLRPCRGSPDELRRRDRVVAEGQPVDDVPGRGLGHIDGLPDDPAVDRPGDGHGHRRGQVVVGVRAVVAVQVGVLGRGGVGGGVGVG